MNNLSYLISEMSNGGDEATELEEQIKLYEIIELIWSLCEILFVDTLPGNFTIVPYQS